MEFESPIDAWYVWVGVVIGSLLVTGIALGLPTEPPPDTDAAVNTIDRVSTSSYDSAGRYEHDADEVKIDTTTVAMRNDGGTEHSSVAFGPLLPLDAVENGTRYDRFDRLLDGVEPDVVLTEEEMNELPTWKAEIHTRLDSQGAAWHPADGELRVRHVRIRGTDLLLVDA